MKLISAVGGGVGGAVVLTLVHETIRKVNPNAPRMDRLGMEAISKTLESAEVKVPEEEQLFDITMAGDLVSNSLYYSLAGIGDKKSVILRGTILGLAAGFGAVYLPKPLGLDPAPSNRTTDTKLMTVGLYLLGGIVASLAGLLIEKNQVKISK